MAKQFRVTLKRSLIGCAQDQRDTVRCIGLKHRQHSIVVKDSPAMRGQIMKVQHMLDVKPE